jgi:hypothetical protein
MRLIQPVLLAAALVFSALALGALPVAAQTVEPASAQRPTHGAYHLGLLSEPQRAELLRRVDSYAVVEVFLKACGRPPALESRFRRLVAGCIRADSIQTLASLYRRAVASRANLRWDCVSTSGRTMIARSEEAIRLTVADIARLCRGG